MKDFFLNTDFSKPLTSDDLYNIKDKLSKRGWITVTYGKDSQITVTIYESHDEYEWEEALIIRKADTFERAFLSCLIHIQTYYEISK